MVALGVLVIAAAVTLALVPAAGALVLRVLAVAPEVAAVTSGGTGLLLSTSGFGLFIAGSQNGFAAAVDGFKKTVVVEDRQFPEIRRN